MQEKFSLEDSSLFNTPKMIEPVNYFSSLVNMLKSMRQMDIDDLLVDYQDAVDTFIVREVMNRIFFLLIREPLEEKVRHTCVFTC